MARVRVQDGAIVADTSIAQATTPKAQKAAGASTTAPSNVGGVSLDVKPDFGKMQKLGAAQAEGNALFAAVCLALIVAVFVIGIAAALGGKLAGFPDWESRGKKAIIFAPVGAFLLSMVGQIVGWGWTLGA